MKIEDIKLVAQLARWAVQEGAHVGRCDLVSADSALEAVEAWLRSVGAITATVKGAKVLDARSRAAGKAGTKRRQRP